MLKHMRFKFWELIAGVLESSVVSFQDEKLEMSSIFMQHEFFCDSSNIVKYTEDSRRWYKLGITFFYLILWLFSVFGVILLDGSIYSSSKWTSRWFTSVSMISNDAECYVFANFYNIRSAIDVRRACIFSSISKFFKLY